MATTLPSSATSLNCDASTDDPKQALLADLYNVIQKFNSLKGALGALAQLSATSGLTTISQGSGSPDLLAPYAPLKSLSGGTTLVLTDRASLVLCTGTFTLALTAAATLGNGWFCYVKNNGSGTITIDPSGSEQVNGATTLALTAGQSVTLINTGSAFHAIGYTVVASQTPPIPVRQTVLSSSVDSSGNPNFMTAGSGLAITVSGSTPIILTAAAGFSSAGQVDRTTSMSSSSYTISGLTASTTNYLYADIDASGGVTLGTTTVVPVYEWGGTPATTSGKFTFNIQDMKGYVGNGSSAPQAYRVYLGEAVTGASSVTSVINYALQGRSTILTASPGGGYVITSAHGIGVDAQFLNIKTGATITSTGAYLDIPVNGYSSSGDTNTPYSGLDYMLSTRTSCETKTGPSFAVYGQTSWLWSVTSYIVVRTERCF